MELRRAATRPKPPLRRNELSHAEAVMGQRPPDRSAQELLVDHRSQVHERARRRGHWNPLMAHDVPAVKRGSAVDPDSRSTLRADARHHYLGKAPIPFNELPKCRG